MSDDETESDSVGPDIDLEKIASESSAESADANESDGTDAEHDDAGDGHGDHNDDHHSVDHDEPEGRTTAPQSDYSARQVAIGALVTAVGIAIAYGVPALLG